MGKVNLKSISIILIIVVAIQIADASKKSGTYRKSFINPYPRFKAYNDGEHPGEPLFLTPLINDPKLSKETVRNMSRVNGLSNLKVDSYSGYLTVNPNYNSNMFFWYFPAEKDNHYQPVVLWLQGGPGASSLFGLFEENGPYEFSHEGKLKKRNFTWTQNQNVIYIDNPVGTGFSFTDKDDGYARNEKDVGRDLHEAIMQLYELFEWTPDQEFWVTGESYAGKYVPALAFHIHKVQNAIETRIQIPLKGLAIGNGLSDPLHQLKYGDYLYQLGLIDDNGLYEFHKMEKKGVDCIEKHNMSCAFEVFDNLINGDLSNGSIFHNLTGYEYYFNYLHTKADEASVKAMGEFLQSTHVRRSLHVGNMTFHDLDTENKVEEHLKLDVMNSVAPWIAELLNFYTVCIYNGQLDIIVAYPLTINYLKQLKFPNADDYKIAKREIWKVDDEIAGYVKHAGHLIEIMVRNAGHMAPSDQPKWMFNLIDHLTHYKTSEKNKYIKFTS